MVNKDLIVLRQLFYVFK